MRKDTSWGPHDRTGVENKDRRLRKRIGRIVGFVFCSVCAGTLFWGCGSSGNNQLKGSGASGGQGAIDGGGSGGVAGSGTAASGGTLGVGGSAGGIGGIGGIGGTGGSVGGQGGSSGAASCLSYGQTCTANADCCSGTCDSQTHTCAPAPNQCGGTGAPCNVGTDCCGLSCNNGTCGAATCTADNAACKSNADCCSKTCTNGTCTPLNPNCLTEANPCTSNSQCCSNYCKGGKCITGSYCIQTGDACSQAKDCCGGICNIPAGKTIGTCAVPAVGSTYCSDFVDGTVCNGCGQCCSRLCAPYGPTGVDICQPASGCHVNGDLCQKASDCCGASGSGVPGDGNVTCVIPAGQTIGVCRNPTGCNPEGNVCHYTNYACSISSARNDCCGAVGNTGVCKIDTLGVPRCYGVTACRTAGQTCADSQDCCNGVPCVPNASGTLVCMQSAPEGGVACVPSGGNCTVDADCCVGLTCIRPRGSIQGTCGVPPPPPGTEGGTTEGGTTDGGTTEGSTTEGGTEAATACALVGQSCMVPTDCCNNGLDGLTCATASNGICNGTMSGCTCHIVIH